MESAIDRVRSAHQGVSGLSSRDRAYSASTPDLAAWVHNTLTESFLVAYRELGLGLTAEEADRFRSGAGPNREMMGADPLPETAEELMTWVRSHPALGPSPGMRSAVAFLRRPPIPAPQMWGHRLLMQGAVAHHSIRDSQVLDLNPHPGPVSVRPPCSGDFGGPCGTVGLEGVSGTLRGALRSQEVPPIRRPTPVTPDSEPSRSGHRLLPEHASPAPGTRSPV